MKSDSTTKKFIKDVMDEVRGNIFSKYHMKMTVISFVSLIEILAKWMSAFFSISGVAMIFTGLLFQLFLSKGIGMSACGVIAVMLAFVMYIIGHVFEAVYNVLRIR